MLRWERARGTLAMYAYSAFLSIDFVLLEFGDVVTDIVNQRHFFGSRFASEDAGESLTHSMHEQLAVGPGEVGSAGHGGHVGFAFFGLQGQTGKLTINQLEAITGLFDFGQLDVIFGDLMPEAATSAVNGHNDLPRLSNAQRFRRVLIIDMLHDLHFSKVVA